MVRKTFNNLPTKVKKFIQYEVKLVINKEIYDIWFKEEGISRRENKETKQENKKRRRNQEIFTDQARGQ